MREHLEMDVRRLVPGEADEAHFALLLRLGQRLDRAAGREVPLGVVFIDHLVDLPEVEMIGLQAGAAIPRASRIENFLSRPCVQSFVIRKTLSRRPLQRFAHQLSLLPSWYSHALSMKVIPPSIASCTMRIDSSLVFAVAKV